MIGRTRTLSLTTTKEMRCRAARRLSVLPTLLVLAGCSPLSSRLCEWSSSRTLRVCCSRHAASTIPEARETAFWASQHERADSEESVELYFLAARLSYLESNGTPSVDSRSESASIYRESVAGLIRTAQRFGRYDTSGGILVEGNDGASFVPISYRGFTWRPRDFTRLVVADRFVHTDLRAQYYREGVGVPLIVLRETEIPERFHWSRSHFAATANLRCDRDAAARGDPEWTLELANPLAVDCVEREGGSVRLAADYSAPSRYAVDHEKRTYLQNFLSPGTSEAEPKLILLEPYQPGKIPLVFVHGLLSDPMTWADLYETIKIDPELRDRYQFWAFQYPTGNAFLGSAAIFRRELAAVVACADPDGTDPALSQIVLVGHSMGGLLCKLQITSSEDQLWRSYANRPLDSLQAPPHVRCRLQEMFFFEPSPHVRRVVYIGTPHNGSSLATRTIGRIGSYLVRIPGAEEREYKAFLAANPGVVHPFAARRIPTSVDMLEPNNPILNAMACLPQSACVATHSIIGIGRYGLCHEPSDGVVPVKSARIPGVESELFVDADHEDLHRDPESIREVIRILREHLLCVDAEMHDLTAESPNE